MYLPAVMRMHQPQRAEQPAPNYRSEKNGIRTQLETAIVGDEINAENN